MKIRPEIQSEFLEQCVKEFKIFIDTSSLLAESAEEFFANITPILEREHRALILPLSVYRELEKLANDRTYCLQKYPNNLELNTRAIEARENIINLNQAHVIDVYGDPDDGDFADNVFLHVFTKMRMKYSLLLITQDKGLASEILRLGKDNEAVKGVKKIIVRRIDKNGFLKKVFDSRENHEPKFSPPQENSSEEIPLNERFALTKEVVQIEGRLNVSHIPGAGEYVTAFRNGKTQKLRLTEKIAAGGEGSVYKTDLSDNRVAKIYKPEKITQLRYEKLKLMLTKEINCEGVCFPRAMIHNQRNEFVGYLMQAASGRELGKSIFMPMLLKKYFPTWNRCDLVQLCVTILEKLKYLHDRNIILGDINPRNILVVSPTEVYFVDTDSYQVEGFICPVGMPLFTPPELQHKEYGLRTLGNENFAIATLLFMIMLPGKPPYSMKDGEGIVENIINGDFAYHFLELKNDKVPTGQWRYCWSHLTYRIKEAFYQTFRYDGTLHDEDKRPNVRYWLKLFENYLESLKNGTMTDWDKESLLIFPTRWKKDRNKTYAKCKLCGKEFDEERLQGGICYNCLNEGEKYRCERCGCEILYSNYQKYVQKVKPPKLCQKCFQKMNKVWERRKCKDCGQMFDITLGEREYFNKNNLSLPIRCKNCRKSTQVIHNEKISKRTILKLFKNKTF